MPNVCACVCSRASRSLQYVLPTSVLQRLLIDAHPSNGFAGGVVRVEATNLEWVGNTFAEHMTERTLRLIREVTRVPAEYVWAAKSTPLKRASPPPRFRRHTISALGLRRLLATASMQGETFWLKYTRLDGATGDETWRTTSAGIDYIVHCPRPKRQDVMRAPRRATRSRERVR